MGHPRKHVQDGRRTDCRRPPVEGMAVGELRELTIAPEMAYGDRGAGDVIPPGATLVFEVELFDLQSLSDPSSANALGRDWPGQKQTESALVVQKLTRRSRRRSGRHSHGATRGCGGSHGRWGRGRVWCSESNWSFRRPVNLLQLSDRLFAETLFHIYYTRSRFQIQIPGAFWGQLPWLHPTFNPS